MVSVAAGATGPVTLIVVNDHVPCEVGRWSVTASSAVVVLALSVMIAVC